MLIRSTVVQTINTEIQHLLADTLDENDILRGPETFQEIGLNSLMLARLTIALESEFGVDPFTQGTSIVDMHKLEDLWAAYEEAIAYETAGR